MGRLDNKAAIITGGAGSIGKATADLFLKEGASVLVVDKNEEALTMAMKEIDSPKLIRCIADVTDVNDVKRFVKEATRQFGNVDIFFNNAGIVGVIKPIQDYPEDVFDEVLAVNVKGVWLGAKHVLPVMNNGGSMIISSSVSGLKGAMNLSGYITSKHAVIGIMRAMAVEFAPKNIRVNSIHPAPVDSPMMRFIENQFSPDGTAQARKEREKRIPFGRYATSEEVAKLVVWLGCDESKFITGTTQIIDGGLIG